MSCVSVRERGAIKIPGFTLNFNAISATILAPRLNGWTQDRLHLMQGYQFDPFHVRQCDHDVPSVWKTK